MTDRTYSEVVDEASRSLNGAAGILNALAAMAEGYVIKPVELEFVADGLQRVRANLDSILAPDEQKNGPALVG